MGAAVLPGDVPNGEFKKGVGGDARNRAAVLNLMFPFKQGKEPAAMRPVGLRGG